MLLSIWAFLLFYALQVICSMLRRVYPCSGLVIQQAAACTPRFIIGKVESVA